MTEKPHHTIIQNMKAFSGKLFHKIKRLVGSAIGDFDLIKDGDHIAVAVSGGKDSYVLLHMLEALRQRAPVSFRLTAVNIDIGFPGYRFDIIEEHLFNPTVVAISLCAGGIVLIFLERGKRQARISEVNLLPYKLAFFIGICQCLAMVPGVSRSAATIIGAMLFGCSRIVAAEFSFFLAIPTMAANFTIPTRLSFSSIRKS